MEIDQIAKRLAVVDGFVPMEEILQAFADRESAIEAARSWRAIALGAGGLAVLAIAAVGMMYFTAAPSMMRLAEYEKSCLDHAAAAQIMSIADHLTAANVRCVRLHEENRDFYEAVSAGTLDTRRVAAALHQTRGP